MLQSAEKLLGKAIPADSISEPGCYLCHWSGHLLRVLGPAGVPGQAPLLSFVGEEPLYVTQLSSNPYLPLSEARLLADSISRGKTGGRKKATAVRATPRKSTRAPATARTRAKKSARGTTKSTAAARTRKGVRKRGSKKAKRR